MVLDYKQLLELAKEVEQKEIEVLKRCFEPELSIEYEQR